MRNQARSTRSSDETIKGASLFSLTGLCTQESSHETHQCFWIKAHDGVNVLIPRKSCNITCLEKVTCMDYLHFFPSFHSHSLVILQAASSQWWYSSSRKPWKPFMCAKNHLVMFPLMRIKEERNWTCMHQCMLQKVCVCMSTWVCQTVSVDVHASGLLLCLTWGEADQLGAG